MSDHHDSNDQEAAYHRFNKEAKAALENNAGRVMIKAAIAGDIYTVNMIMDHDSTLHGTKKIATGHIRNPNYIYTEHLSEAITKAIANDHYNIAILMIERGHTRLNPKILMNLSNTLIRQISQDGGNQPAYSTLKTLAELADRSYIDKTFTQTVDRLVASDNPSHFAKNFDKYMQWNRNKNKYFALDPKERATRASENINNIDQWKEKRSQNAGASESSPSKSKPNLKLVK